MWSLLDVLVSVSVMIIFSRFGFKSGICLLIAPGWSCEPNIQLNVCTTSVTEGEVGPVKLV